MADLLLSRYAENMFWLARYVERAENLARILDVNETFSRDSRGGQNWRSVLQLYADEERFTAAARHGDRAGGAPLLRDRRGEPDLDRQRRCGMARENARALRPLISTEMWTQLNVFHNRLGALGEDALAPGNLRAAVRPGQGGLPDPYRHHRGHLLPRPGLVLLPHRPLHRARRPDHPPARHQVPPAAAEPGGCRLAAGREPVERAAALGRRIPGLPRSRTRRASRRRGSPGFLLLDRRFPRSVALLRARGGIAARRPALAARAARRDRRGGGAGPPARRARHAADRARSSKKGLHQFLDMLQRQLIAVSDDLGTTFFGQGAQSQSQSQSGPSGSQSQSQSQSRTGQGSSGGRRCRPFPPAQR